MSTSYVRYPNTGSGVTSLNAETGAITLVGGTGITVTPAGQNITISSSGSTFPLLAPNGSLAAPSYSFSGSTNSGMLFASSRVEISSGGTLAAAFTNAGIVETNGVLLTTRGEARFQDSTTHLITMKASTTSAAYTFVLPSAAPTNGQVLSYDSGLGETTWSAPGGTTYPLLAPNGTAGAPSYSFSAASNVGIYSDGTNIEFAVGGALVAEVATIGFNLPTGLVRTGNGLVATPSHSFYSHNDMGMYTDGTSIFFTLGGGVFTSHISPGVFYMNGSFQGTNGTVTNPSLSFSSSPDTGFYTDGASRIFASTAGVLALTIDNTLDVTFSGHLLAANGTAGAPAYSFSSIATMGAYSDGTNYFLSTGGVQTLKIAANGTFTIGPSGSAADHVIRGGSILLTTSSSSSLFEIIRPSTDGSLGISAQTNLANGGVIELYGSTNATPNIARISTAGAAALTIDASQNVAINAGTLSVSTAGKGLQVKEGSNAKQGVSTMSGGTVVVSNTSVTATSRIFLTVQSLGTVAVATPIAVTARTAGTSFTISSSAITDTSVVAWEIFEPA